MKKRGHYAVAGWLAAALVVGLCLRIPTAYTALRDVHLREHIHPRPAVEGVLDEKAQDIPLVYALYRKRNLSNQFASSGTHIQTSAQECKTLLEEKLDCLLQANVLTEIMLEGAWETLEKPASWHFFTKNDNQFSSAGYFSESQVEMSWHEETGLVVACCINAKKLDWPLEKILDAYRSYLGLDCLDDWKSLRDNGPDGVSIWSAQGQIYLCCTTLPSGLFLGAYSVEEEDILPLLQMESEGSEKQ